MEDSSYWSGVDVSFYFVSGKTVEAVCGLLLQASCDPRCRIFLIGNHVSNVFLSYFICQFVSLEPIRKQFDRNDAQCHESFGSAGGKQL